MQQDIQKCNFTQLDFKADSNPTNNSFNENNTLRINTINPYKRKIKQVCSQDKGYKTSP